VLAIVAGLALSKSRAVDVVPPAASTVAARTQVAPGEGDLFDGLRAASTAAVADPSWSDLAAALSHIETLEGAAVDPATGQLLLSGRYTEGQGPFTLEDIAVTLRAAFYENEPVGMTIDENPDDKRGPEMFVRFFAGTANTRLGQVMFECDRLMKSLGLGRDSITKATLSANAAGFHSHADLIRASNSRRSGSSWNRFWLNLATGRYPDKDARGKPLVEVSDDRHTIWFQRHRVYIDTEAMFDPGKGFRLASTGREDATATAFADGFVAHYDEIAKQFPVFRELHELSKLVVLAEWIRDQAIAIDHELLFHRLGDTKTPERTPSVSSEFSWDEGRTRNRLTLFGGVGLDPHLQYASGKNNANAFAKAADGHRSELQSGRSARWATPDGAPQQIVVVGPQIRGPTPVAATRRRPLGVSSPLTGKVDPTSRPVREVFGQYKFGVSTTVESHEILNLPVLREVPNARRTDTFTVSDPNTGQRLTVDVPAGLSITSPLRDINVRFDMKPLIDQMQRLPYFRSVSSDEVRYYPTTRTVRLSDGTSYRFDDNGILKEFQGADGHRLQLEATEYRDGPLEQVVFASLDARGPPQASKPTPLKAESARRVQQKPRPVLRMVESNGRIKPTSQPMSLTITGPTGASAHIATQPQDGRFTVTIP